MSASKPAGRTKKVERQMVPPSQGKNKIAWFQCSWYSVDDDFNTLPSLDLAVYLCFLDETEKALLDSFRTCDRTELEMVEQKSDKWLAARKGRTTGSNGYKFAGRDVRHSRFKNVCELIGLSEKPSFSNKFMQHGVDHEDIACIHYTEEQQTLLDAAFQAYVKTNDPSISFVYRGVEVIPKGSLNLQSMPCPKVTVRSTGMIVDAQCPWRAVSLDGVVCINDVPVWVIEIKCPMGFNQQYELYPFIPYHYIDQVQCNLYLSQQRYPGVQFIDFYVYSTRGTSCETFYLLPDRFQAYLLQEFKFYFLLYLPGLVHFEACCASFPSERKHAGVKRAFGSMSAQHVQPYLADEYRDRKRLKFTYVYEP